jgi:hypothetical protein
LNCVEEAYDITDSDDDVRATHSGTKCTVHYFFIVLYKHSHDMGSRKRSRDVDMHIKLAAGASVPAESFLLRKISDVARDLPAASAEWDVSGLLLNGQPFSNTTVQCWLDCAYYPLYGTAELDPEDLQHISTVKGLHDVLAFAHAVGSPEGLLKAACSQLKSLKFVVQLPEQTLELPLSAHSLYFRAASQQESQEDGHQLAQISLREAALLGGPLTAQQRSQVQRTVATQAGELLRIAHVLRLQVLIDAVHNFVFASALGTASVLYGFLGLVFTDAVLEASLGSSTISKETYISSVLSRPCSFTSGIIGLYSLLKPLGAITAKPSTDVVEFDAQLLCDFAGASKGETVHAELDLFAAEGGARICLSRGTVSCLFPAQLLLGSVVHDSGHFNSLMQQPGPG